MQFSSYLPSLLVPIQVHTLLTGLSCIFPSSQNVTIIVFGIGDRVNKDEIRNLATPGAEFFTSDFNQLVDLFRRCTSKPEAPPKISCAYRSSTEVSITLEMVDAEVQATVREFELERLEDRTGRWWPVHDKPQAKTYTFDGLHPESTLTLRARAVLPSQKTAWSNSFVTKTMKSCVSHHFSILIHFVFACSSTPALLLSYTQNRKSRMRMWMKSETNCARSCWISIHPMLVSIRSTLWRSVSRKSSVRVLQGIGQSLRSFSFPSPVFVDRFPSSH